MDPPNIKCKHDSALRQQQKYNRPNNDDDDDDNDRSSPSSTELLPLQLPPGNDDTSGCGRRLVAEEHHHCDPTSTTTLTSFRSMHGDGKATSLRRSRMILSLVSVTSTLLVFSLGKIIIPHGINVHPSLRSTGSLSPLKATGATSPVLLPRLLQEQEKDDIDTIDVGTNETCTLDCCKAFESQICDSSSSAGDGDNNWIQAVPSWAQIVIVIILLMFSALFSGLTLGLMSLDLTGLEIVMAGDDEKLAAYANHIYPIRKSGNLLLCTLLLGNVAVNSLLSIFLGEVAGGTVGFLVSTMLIVIFGEILPQALCSRYALQIGSATVPIVKVIRLILLPVSWPLAKCLDWLLGRELATTYTSAEMMELLKIHVKENKLNPEAANAMTGALTYQQITVKEAMTTMERTFMLGVDEKLSFDTIGKIFKTGFSRIPIYEISRNNVIGLLFVKDLIFIDPEDEVPIRSFIQIFGRAIELVWPDDTLGDVLAELKKGRSHLAVVRDVNNEDEAQDPFYEIKGIITLEDIVERILGDAIVDETDAFIDNSHDTKVERPESFEWARLRLLDTKIVDEMLSASEIAAVTAHLKTNYSSCFKLITDIQLNRLVSRTPVNTFPTAQQELGQELPNDLLYEKGKSAAAFTLILSGKVTIIVGSENFRSDLSSWSVLGKSALERSDWKPDFTAFVSDGPCRCIQISHAAFVEAIDASTEERLMTESKIGTVALSVASSNVDDGHSSVDGRSSTDGHVPNRRGVVLAKLFPHAKTGEKIPVDENTPETGSSHHKATTVQFVTDELDATAGDGAVANAGNSSVPTSNGD